MPTSTKILIIDTRVSDYTVFITSKQEGVLHVTYDYYTDTYASLTSRILNELNGSLIESVALVSHAVTGVEFKLLENEESAVLEGVESSDPTLRSWIGFSGFWMGIGATVIDLLGCALYMNDDWRYVLDNLEKQMGVNFRASIDDTGALAVGANWVLESEVEYVNAKDIYFTEGIEEWTGLLIYGGKENTFYIDNSGDAYIWGSSALNTDLDTFKIRDTPSLLTYFSKINKQIQKAALQKYITRSHSAFIVTDGIGSVLDSSNGQLWMVGLNTSGQLGTGDFIMRNDPVLVINGGCTDVDCGSEFTAAIVNGRVYTWGLNTNGQLGDGTNITRNTPVQPVDASGSSTIKFTEGCTSIACGERHMIIVHNGAVWTWGLNSSGQLGDNTSIGKNYPVRPVTSVGSVTLTSGITKVVASAQNSGCLNTSGGISIWGHNGSGQLSISRDVTTKSENPYTPPAYSSGCTDIGTGNAFIMVIKNGNLFGCGNNDSGKIGSGSSNNLITSFAQCVDICNNPLSQCTKIMCGYSHSTVITNGGIMSCGSNSMAALGALLTDTSCNRFIRPVVSWGTTTSALTTNCSYIYPGTSCTFVKQGNDCYHIGATSYLLSFRGYSSTLINIIRPNIIDFFTKINRRVHKVSIGNFAGLVLTTSGRNSTLTNRNGEVWAVDNARNDPYARTVLSFTRIIDASGNDMFTSGATDIAIGGHAAVICNGRVYLWNLNKSTVDTTGVLGRGKITTDANYIYPAEPVDASGSSTIKFTSGCTSVVCGNNFTVVINNGAVWTWGMNTSGQLGDNTLVTKSFPVQLRDASNNPVLTSNVSKISAGSSYAGALVNGQLWQWGSNASRQIVNSGTTIFSNPTARRDGSSSIINNISNFSCGSSHTIFVSNNLLYTVGINSSGQLGNNSIITSGIPVQPRNPDNTIWDSSGVTSLVASSNLSIVNRSGNIFGFGDNNTTNGRILYSDISNETRYLTPTYIPTDTSAVTLNDSDVSFSIVLQSEPVLSGLVTVNSLFYGQDLSSAGITATFIDSSTLSNVAGTIAFNTPSTKPSTGTTQYPWTFTPTYTSSYTTQTGSVNVTVNQTTPCGTSITVSATDISYGQTLVSSSISYTGDFINTFDSTIINGTVAFTSPSTSPSAGTASYSWTFTPSDSTNYDTQTGSVSVTINKATPDVSGSITSSPIRYGQQLSLSIFTGTMKNSNNSEVVTGSFAFSSPTTKPSSTTTHNWSFTPDDTLNYNNQTGTVTVLLNRATPSTAQVIISTSDIFYGQTLASSTISYTGNFKNPYDSSTITGSIAFIEPSIKPT